MAGQSFEDQMRLGALRDQRLGNEFRDQMAAGTANFRENMQTAEMQSGLRQQAITEELQRRGWTLNEINAVLTGAQVGMPTMPTFMGANRSETTDYMGAAQNQYTGDLNRFNATQGARQGLMTGIAGLATGGSDLWNAWR
jgi:hypothetical protein